MADAKTRTQHAGEPADGLGAVTPSEDRHHKICGDQRTNSKAKTVRPA